MHAPDWRARPLMTFRRGFIVAVMVTGLLATAGPTFAQIRRIQGKVVDEVGNPVSGAAVEVTLVALTDTAFAYNRMRNSTELAQTNANGDYIVTVPIAGEYLVTATKQGFVSDQTKVATRSGLVTAHLTLWTSRPAGVAGQNCGTTASIEALKPGGLAAGAAPGLSRLLSWLKAVYLHTPGCSDAAVIEIGRLALVD